MAETWTPDRVLALRQRLGLSQQGLAERLHITVATVHRWEAGKAKPTRHAAWLLDEVEREEQGR